MVRRNILANAVGGSTAILLNLVVTPFLIRILGAEAYGLLGLMTSLQVVFSVLDLGLSTTVIRELAGDTSGGRTATRSLVQTLAMLYWIIALVLGAALFVSARWLVSHWLHLQDLSVAEATLGVQILAVSVALRWPIAFYSGVITGVQQLSWLNAIRVTSSVVRLGGGLAILLVRRDLTIYLWWLALSALFEVALFVAASFRLLPTLRAWPSMKLRALRSVWQFSLSMNVISILSLIFTQADRLMISRLRPLAELGYYSLAVNVVMSLSVIQGFITSAILPAMVADYSAGNMARLSLRYAKATQVLLYVITLPACVFVFFGYDLLRVWVSADAAERSYVVLALFGVGFLLNASVSIAYTLAIASGKTRIPLLVNLVALVGYGPGLYFATVRWGITGAASAWVALNVYYLFTLFPLVQVRIARESVTAWLTGTLLPFPLRGVVTFSLAMVIARWWQFSHGLAFSLLMCMLAGTAYAGWALFALTPSLRHDILQFSRALVPRLRGAT